MEGRDSEQRIRPLVEQSEPAVAVREAVAEPRWQRAGCPAVEQQLRLLLDVVPHAVPVERGPAADVEAREAAF
jgi:hypothetical protein